MWVKNLVTPSLARKRWLAPTKSQPGYFNWINKLIWLIQHVDWLNILIDSVWWLTQHLYWLRMMIDTAWWLTHNVDWHRMLIYTACWRNQHVAWPSMLSQSACKVNQQGGFVVCMYSTVWPQWFWLVLLMDTNACFMFSQHKENPQMYIIRISKMTKI